MGRLSVVVPVKNQEQFIRSSLDSLLGQADLAPGELQVIVIDGGSTDGTAEAVKTYSGSLHYWVSEPDEGQTQALIKGFSRATGSLMAWLCADDELERHAVREVLDYFEQYPTVRFVYGDVTWIGRDGQSIQSKREIPFNWFIWTYGFNYIPQPATFWRRDLYHKVGGLNPDFHCAMDADLWARFAKVSKPVHVPRLWAKVRLYPEQKTQRLRHRSEAEDRLVREKLGVDYHHTVVVFLLHLVARGLRVIIKLVRGCYS